MNLIRRTLYSKDHISRASRSATTTIAMNNNQSKAFGSVANKNEKDNKQDVHIVYKEEELIVEAMGHDYATRCSDEGFGGVYVPKPDEPSPVTSPNSKSQAEIPVQIQHGKQ